MRAAVPAAAGLLALLVAGHAFGGGFGNSQGGTSSDPGLASIAAITSGADGQVLAWGGSGWVNVGPGSSGEVLTSNGAGSLPSFQAAGGGGGSDLATTLAAGNTTGGTNLIVSVGDSLSCLDDVAVSLGASADAALLWSTAQTNDSVMLSVGASNQLLITSAANRLKDHQRGVQTSPSLFVYAATDVASDPTHYLRLTHDGTNGTVDAGGGNDRFNVVASQIMAPAGSAGTPGVSHGGGLTTGLYFSGGTLGLSAGGSSKLLVGTGLTAQAPVTFGTGLGAVSQIVGPSDQGLEIEAAGLNTLILNTASGGALGLQTAGVNRILITNTPAIFLSANTDVTGDLDASGEVEAARLSLPPQSVTTTPVTAGANSILLVDATSGAITIALPAAATSTGRTYWIKKTDSSSNAVTVDPDGAELIDSAATFTLLIQNEVITVVSDGTSWWIL